MHDDDSIPRDVGRLSHLGLLAGDSYIELSSCCFASVGRMVMVEDSSYPGLPICLVDRPRMPCITADVDPQLANTMGCEQLRYQVWA